MLPATSRAHILPSPSIAPIPAFPPEEGCQFFIAQTNSAPWLFATASTESPPVSIWPLISTLDHYFIMF